MSIRNEEQYIDNSPKYIDLVKLPRDELEALEKSYEMEIKEKEERSVISYLSKKLKKDLRLILPKMLKYEFIALVVAMIFIFVFMSIASFFGWFQQDEYRTIVTIIIMAPFLILMIPLIVTTMLMETERTSSDYTTLDRINSILESKYYVYDFLISPEKPFANDLHYIETIRACRDNIYLLDKYYTTAGFDLLYKGLEGKTDVSTIKIITTPDKADENLRKSYKKIKTEFKARGINIELRIFNKKSHNEIHDRYLITGDKTFLLPSPDVVKRGQYATITGVNHSIPFQKYWDVSIDIINGWEKIEKK